MVMGFMNGCWKWPPCPKPINPQPATANKSNNPAATKNTNEVTGFKAAVVFVIDSTISMDPYINRTREAVKKLYEKVENRKFTGTGEIRLDCFSFEY